MEKRNYWYLAQNVLFLTVIGIHKYCTCFVTNKICKITNICRWGQLHQHCGRCLLRFVNTNTISLPKKIVCFSHWVVTLVAEKLRRQWLWKAYFGIRGQLNVSNLRPNCTLQLKMLKTSVRESLQIHLIKIKVTDFLTDVQWLLHLQDGGCKIVLELPLWLSYAISKVHNT